jgi:hypothetical protein
MNDRPAIDVANEGHQVLIEFGFGGSPIGSLRRKSDTILTDGTTALTRATAGSHLDREPASRHVTPSGGRRVMASKLAFGIAVLAMVLEVAGCEGARSTTCQCPKPVAYDEATLKKISQALRALPSDNVLHQAMEDYESERDDLRFCP